MLQRELGQARRTGSPVARRAADLVAHAAEAEAIARGVAPVIAVVDDGGTLTTIRRPDASQVASVAVARLRGLI